MGSSERNWIFDLLLRDGQVRLSRLAHNQEIVGSNPTPATTFSIFIFSVGSEGGSSLRRGTGGAVHLIGRFRAVILPEKTLSDLAT